LLDATIDSHGDRHPALEQRGRRVVSPATATEMTKMLTGVVSDGTGACAAIPGYIVAGKTGTSRKAVDGGYSHGTMASFIGFAPAQRPRLAAIVVLDEPTTQYGGAAAAPVFSNVMQFALTRSDVAPDDVGNTQFNAAQATAQTAGANCEAPEPAVFTPQTTPSTVPRTTTSVPTPTSAPRRTSVSTTTSAPATPARSKATPSSLGHDTSQSG
jgi:cell division protein FtsI (penicillin-binding protein 3)